jgi:hypothetical protein
VLYFVEARLDDEGTPWLAVTTDGVVGGIVGGLDGSPLTNFGYVGNVPLAGKQPFSVGVSAFGEALSIWSDDSRRGQVLALLCPQPADVVPLSGSATLGEPEEGSRGLSSVEGMRVLVAGDRLDTDGDELADATVEAIDPDLGGAPEVSADGSIVLRLDLRRDSDPGVVRQALVRLISPVCPMFADGFESGDASLWSSTTP